jgi:thioredoxin-like negative regulator of GroEL
MAPIVDGLEEQYREQIVFKRINANADDGPTIARAYRIPGHPTTILFDQEGNEVQRLLGPQPMEVVEQAVQRIVP